MNPSLASASHAADLFRCACFCLVAPGFRAQHAMWLPGTLVALAEVVELLREEASALAMVEAIDPELAAEAA